MFHPVGHCTFSDMKNYNAKSYSVIVLPNGDAFKGNAYYEFMNIMTT